MKSLAFALCVCALVASGSVSAGQTCKAKANQQKLVGEAFVSFVKQCESDVLMVCANLAAGKPDSDAFMDACAVKALGVGPRWCNPHHCKTSSDCVAVRGVVFAGRDFAETKSAGVCLHKSGVTHNAGSDSAGGSVE